VTNVSDIFMTARSLRSNQVLGIICGPAARIAADWLCLAAMPIFAIMALLTAFGGRQQDLLCAAMHHASPFSGMAPMYLLMSVFHSAPWLKLISRRRSGAVLSRDCLRYVG
jgi:hypothetical protein